MAKQETPIVTVKGTGNDNKVVLWERDKAHPDGEIFVSNDGNERQVALTPAVKTLMREGRLEEVEGAKPAAKKSDNKPATATEPWGGYDAMTADEVLAKLPELDDAGRAQVLAYEKGKGARGRKSVIEKLVNWDS